MLLAIDIGNTTISFAVMRKLRAKETWEVETARAAGKRRQAIITTLKKIKGKYPKVARVLICSVVPSAQIQVERAVSAQLKIKPKLVGRDVTVPIKNKYRNPRQVGQDRLVGAFAASQVCGTPVIIVDFGTATTFDVVSRSGSYEGGIIVPGIRLTTDMLYTNTAMLPNIQTIKSPKSLIGKDTRESILSGIFHGYGAMCEGLIDRIASHLKCQPKIVITGGYTRLMRKYISHKITNVDRNLVFKGLALLAHKK